VPRCHLAGEIAAPAGGVRLRVAVTTETAAPSRWRREVARFTVARNRPSIYRD